MATNADANVRKEEALFTTGGNVNLYNYYGYQCGDSSQN